MLGNDYVRLFLVFVARKLARIASLATAVHATREILRQIFFSRLPSHILRDIRSRLPALLLEFVLELVLLVIQLPCDGLRLFPRLFEFGLQL